MERKIENPRRYLEKMISESPYTREQVKSLLIARGVIKSSTTELSDRKMIEVADGIKFEIEHPEMFTVSQDAQDHFPPDTLPQ